MTFFHNAGPFLAFGEAKGSPIMSNPDAGPDVNYQGDSVIDQRTGYAPGQNTKVYSYFNCPYMQIYNGTPATLSATCLLNAVAPPGAGTAYAITAGTGIVSNATVINQITGVTVSTTAFAVNEAYTPLVVGRNNLFNPGKATTRVLTIKSSGADTAVIKINGWDIFGQAMNESITLNGTNAVNGKKAWKYINSITPTTNPANNVSVGTTDIYGFNLYSGQFEQMNIFWNGAYITATTGWTGGLGGGFPPATGTPSSATTADTRGTYALQTSASNGAQQLTMYITLLPNQLTNSIVNANTSAMFGLAQF